MNNRSSSSANDEDKPMLQHGADSNGNFVEVEVAPTRVPQSR